MQKDIRTSILRKFKSKQTVRYSDLFQLYKTIAPEARFPSKKEEWQEIVVSLRSISGFETLSIDNVTPTLRQRITETLQDAKDVLSILTDTVDKVADEVSEAVTEIKEVLNNKSYEDNSDNQTVGGATEGGTDNEGTVGGTEDTSKPQPKRKRKKAAPTEGEQQ